MIDPSTAIAPDSARATVSKPVFRMTASDRMAGSVPAWVRPGSAQDIALARLDSASAGQTFSDAMSEALSYQESPPHTPAAEEKPFDFGDLVDIVNPLPQGLAHVADRSSKKADLVSP